jgi:hypothetical protein
MHRDQPDSQIILMLVFRAFVLSSLRDCPIVTLLSQNPRTVDIPAAQTPINLPPRRVMSRLKGYDKTDKTPFRPRPTPLKSPSTCHPIRVVSRHKGSDKTDKTDKTTREPKGPFHPLRSRPSRGGHLPLHPLRPTAVECPISADPSATRRPRSRSCSLPAAQSGRAPSGQTYSAQRKRRALPLVDCNPPR